MLIAPNKTRVLALVMCHVLRVSLTYTLRLNSATPEKKFSLGSALWVEAVDQANDDCGQREWVVLWKEKTCSIWKMTFMSPWGLVTVAGDAAIHNSLKKLQGDADADTNKETG